MNTEDYLNIFVKDPGAKLDYRFDWAALTNGTGLGDWLALSETIVTSTITVQTGLTKVSDTIESGNTVCVVWLSGGTANVNYEVVNHIITSGGREDERTILIKVRNL